MGNFIHLRAINFHGITETSGGIVGLVIVSTLTLTVNLQWAMRQTAETENFMTSFERAMEYTSLEPEAPWETGTYIKLITYKMQKIAPQ